MPNGDVHDEISDQFLEQFDKSVGVSGMQKLQQFPQLQKLGHAGTLSHLKNDFHGLTDFKAQMTKYSSVNRTLRVAWALISALVPNNPSILLKLTSIPGLGSVGKDFLSIHNFGQVFSLSPGDLKTPGAVQEKASVYQDQSTKASVVDSAPSGFNIGGGAGISSPGNANQLQGVQIVGLPSNTNNTLQFVDGHLVWQPVTGGGGGGSSAWGSITGVLSAQTDLQSALNLKAPINDAHLTGITTTEKLISGNIADLSAYAANATSSYTDPARIVGVYRNDSPLITAVGMTFVAEGLFPQAVSIQSYGAVEGAWVVGGEFDAAADNTGAPLNVDGLTALATWTGADNIGNVGVAVGLWVFSGFKSAHSTITDQYGIRIEDQNHATGLNYAIKTGLGKVDFGDTVNAPAYKVSGHALNYSDLAGTPPSSPAVWGGITGTLSSQTDLQSALDLKAPLASPTFTGTATTARLVAPLIGNGLDLNDPINGGDPSYPYFSQQTATGTMGTGGGVGLNINTDVTVLDGTNLASVYGTSSSVTLQGSAPTTTNLYAENFSGLILGATLDVLSMGQVIGLESAAYKIGNVGTLAQMWGFLGSAVHQSGTGTITEMVGAHYRTFGAATTNIGLRVDMVAATGTTVIGLDIKDMPIPASQYSLRTGLGLVSFGDTGVIVNSPTADAHFLLKAEVDGSKYAFTDQEYFLKNQAATIKEKLFFSCGAEGHYSDLGVLSVWDFYIYNDGFGDYSMSIDGVTNQADFLSVVNGINGFKVAGHALTFTDLAAHPTTLSGYGITDGMANPMTTLGDIIYEDATPVPARLAGNTTTTRKFLRQTGTGSISAVPAWDTLASGDIPSLSSLYLALATGGSVTGDVAVTGQISATKRAYSGQITVASSVTPTFNLSLADSFFITVTANVTGMTFSNLVAGQKITLVILQDGTGGWTWNWAGANVTVNNAPTINSASGSYTILTFTTDGSALYTESTTSSSGGSLPSRVTTTASGGSLNSVAANANVTGTVTLVKAFTLEKVVAAFPSRIRLYSTSAARDADVTRARTSAPAPGVSHGIICDLYLDGTSASTTWKMSPAVLGCNLDTSPSSSIYYSITNIDSATRNLSVSFTYVQMES